MTAARAQDMIDGDLIQHSETRLEVDLAWPPQATARGADRMFVAKMIAPNGLWRLPVKHRASP